MGSSTSARPMMRRAVSTIASAGLLVGLLAGSAGTAAAGVNAFTYGAVLDGPSESPPNASPGTGTAVVDFDLVDQTMRVQITFSGLVGLTSAAHIHSATAVAGEGAAGVATQTPTFTGFPLGVTSGSYDHTFVLTELSTWNSSFVTSNGGTASGAAGALAASLAAGTAYVNVHSSAFPGGEIRGFLELTDGPDVPKGSGKFTTVENDSIVKFKSKTGKTGVTKGKIDFYLGSVPVYGTLRVVGTAVCSARVDATSAWTMYAASNLGTSDNPVFPYLWLWYRDGGKTGDAAVGVLKSDPLGICLLEGTQILSEIQEIGDGPRPISSGKIKVK